MTCSGRGDGAGMWGLGGWVGYLASANIVINAAKLIWLVNRLASRQFYFILVLLLYLASRYNECLILYCFFVSLL